MSSCHEMEEMFYVHEIKVLCNFGGFLSRGENSCERPRQDKCSLKAECQEACC